METNKVICNWCNKPKDGVSTGLCNHCGRFGKTESEIKRVFNLKEITISDDIKHAAFEWFSVKTYIEQHKLSDKYFDSKNPSLLTDEQVIEVYTSEHLYCVSSNSLVYGNSCEKWCGDQNCLKK